MIPGAGPAWETALLVPVPAAEPAVGRHRARIDEAARDGVPAHITVLYPFLPPARISDRLLASLGRLFAGVAAFEFKLDRIGWSGEEVVWLGPRDPTPFSILTSLTFTAFPSSPFWIRTPPRSRTRAIFPFGARARWRIAGRSARPVAGREMAPVPR